MVSPDLCSARNTGSQRANAELIIFVILVTKLPCSALASEQACVDYGPPRTPAWTIVHWS